MHSERCAYLSPPLAEQKRIAEVLGVWDRAIEVAGKQLDLARTQKRALMQTLLTPTRRFPGYEGQPWKEVRLGDVLAAKRQKGKIVETNEEREGLPYIGATSLSGNFSAFTETPDAVICKPNDLLVLWDGENAGEIGTSLHGAVSSTVVRYQLNRTILNTKFLFYRMQLDRYRIREVREGSGIPHMPGDFEDWYRFDLPSKEEQDQIVDIIDVSKTEITTLETQITRLQAEKKALMQQLLTGQKRLAV